MLAFFAEGRYNEAIQKISLLFHFLTSLFSGNTRRGLVNRGGCFRFGCIDVEKGRGKKKNGKIWKTLLTNPLRSGNISKLSETKASVPCKLNNVKTNYKHLGQLMELFKRKRKTANENSWVILLRANYSKTWFEPRKRFRYNFLRVWSWLRTNAGGVPNTCKSNGVKPFGTLLSGERVSNAWGTCLSVGDNSWKRLLIPHNAFERHRLKAKDLLLKDGLASD